jgi:hypothetical protein
MVRPWDIGQRESRRQMLEEQRQVYVLAVHYSHTTHSDACEDLPRIIVRSLSHFGLHLGIVHDGILHLAHPGFNVVEGQVRDRLLEAFEIHDGWLAVICNL